MKTVLAVIVCLLLFLLGWFLLAGLLYVMGWAALKTGEKPGLFFLIHILLMLVLSPGVGAGVAIYATTTTFKSVAPIVIFTGFVSVCAVLLLLGFLSGALSFVRGSTSIGQLIIFLLQAAAIFVGARIGRAAAS